MSVSACGYADGYPRHCPTGTPVLVDGMRTRLLGRVSMDMIAVDLTPLPQEAGFGSAVTLWGHAERNSALLSIDEVAKAAGTVGYELMWRARQAGTCTSATRGPGSNGTVNRLKG